MLRWVARVALVVVVSMCIAGSAAAADEPWRDASQPPGQRADELLAAMTPDQKVAMALGDFASLASLGVPTLPSDDGPSGIRADGTTSFPSAQTLAATFDRDLARAYGEAIGAEARGKGFNWWLGPAMDIARTPLAGRQPENLGEDPFLAGETVAQEVGGAKSRHVIATLKHYVANNAEWGRIGFNTPTGAQRRRQRDRLRAGAAGDLRGAVQARDPRVRSRRGDVLLQPPQRAADVREPGAALRPQGLGLQRLRGA